MVEKNAPWRQAAAVDPWTKETDPSAFAGDEWVAEGDPGVRKGVTKNDLEQNPLQATERFMHPQHNVEG